MWHNHVDIINHNDSLSVAVKLGIMFSLGSKASNYGDMRAIVCFFDTHSPFSKVVFVVFELISQITAPVLFLDGVLCKIPLLVAEVLNLNE